MAEMKNYVWSWREFVFQDGGSIVNLSLKKEDIDKLPVSEKWYIAITVAAKKEADQYGNTHNVYENTYKKEEKAI